MPVMDIRKVRMSVDHRVVLVRMGVRFAPVPRKIVAMPVMLVMPVRVLVRHRLVRMHMFMAFGEMQIDAQRHQGSRHGKLQRNHFARNEDRKHGTEEWRDGEIGARARGAQMS